MEKAFLSINEKSYTKQEVYNLIADLTDGLEQLAMDFDCIRMAMCDYDKEFFKSCYDRAMALVKKGKGEKA